MLEHHVPQCITCLSRSELAQRGRGFARMRNWSDLVALIHPFYTAVEADGVELGHLYSPSYLANFE
jgi:hypothetical protein